MHEALLDKGIDSARLSVTALGAGRVKTAIPRWLIRMGFGIALSALLHLARHFEVEVPHYLGAFMALAVGLLILQAACEVLVTATERLAARFKWDHYIAGTVAEILSTLPEFVVIAFLIPVSPTTAFVICIVTIYNNALVFSLYSFFLPKDKQGKYLMPTPITEAGTQILIGGGSMGLILGLVMLTFHSSGEAKSSFHVLDLIFISIILLSIFGVYVYKLVSSYAREEAEVRETLNMSNEDVKQRLDLVYENVQSSTGITISLMFLAGVLGAVIGGEEVSRFATTMIGELAFNPILTALILALFAGMSEYVILWQSHKKQEYGIALANAFGGITQVMFLVLPFTLLGIAVYEVSSNAGHDELPLQFSLTSIFLLLFLFPTFYTLSSLLEEDHTLGLLDTTIMTGIFSFLIVLLVTYGN